MKSRFLIVRKSPVVVLAALVFGLFFAFQVEGQTKKKKTKKATTQPVVNSTALSQQTLPEIISRADDFSNENQTVVTENPTVEQTETADEKIEKVNSSISDLNGRIKSLESTQKNEYDEKQKRLLLNLDILTRAEQRVEALRKQLFDIIEKQNSAQSRLDQLEYESKPEIVERYSALTGSLKPEAVRDARKQMLDKEKANLQSLLQQIETNRASLEESVRKADFLVLKLRSKLEKDIENALNEETGDQP